eukprot:7449150-Alexandrium_andersonii.AAC.1
MVRYLRSRTRSSLLEALQSMISTYHQQRFNVVNILCDGESAVGAILSESSIRGVMINTTSKNEHVPEIEVSIKHVKERVRCNFHKKPYKMYSILIAHLVYYCVRAINMEPSRAVLGSGKVSPRELFLGRVVDASKELKLGFGEYVQVHEDNSITNTMEARTQGAISLGPCGNVQ